MTILNETPNLEPLMRIMGLPPSLVRYCPGAAELKLRTMRLADSALGKSVDAAWGDDCLLTTVDGEHDKLAHVKLTVPAGRKPYAGLHLAFFGGKGQIQLVLGGDHLRVVIGAGTLLRAGLHLAGKASVFIGDNTTMGQARLSASNADLVVGDDCQFSEDVVVQASDQHSLVDAASGAVLHTERRHVRIGRHVWLGRRAMVQPDVTLGAGCVVESGAVVTRDVAANTLVGGAPAVVLREGVSWKR